MATCNQACIIALPVVIAVLGTSLIFVTTYTIYLRRQHALCRPAGARDPEKAHRFAHGRHPTISEPMPIPGSGPDVRGLIPIIRTPSAKGQESASMPTIRYSSTPEKSPEMGCPELTVPDRVRVAIGLKPRCPCRHCRDNPRAAPGYRTHHQSMTHTSRELEITIPPASQRPTSSPRPITRKGDDVGLPIYIHGEDDTSLPPGYPKRVSSTESEYSQTNNSARLPSQISEPQLQPQPLQPSRPSPPISPLTPRSLHVPPPPRRVNPHLQISLAKSSHASLRSPGLPASPRPSHRPTVSESLVPRLPRDLVSVGLAVDHQDVVRDVLEGGLGPELEGLQLREREKEKEKEKERESAQGVEIAVEMPARTEKPEDKSMF